jgi:SAM-dependent methyltransferase
VDDPRPTDAARLYDEFAERFEQHAETAVWNAQYDRPAVLALLGDVAGLRVLDAGCGPGIYVEELLARGADVIAVDGSERMVQLTRTRVGDRARVRQHDLNLPLHFLDDGSVDRVVSALVWHYLDERLAALREFHRVLAPAGRVVISTDHPTDDWLRNGGSYFAVEAKVEHWTSLDARFASWRVPLTVLCDEFATAGFVIERLVEPLPTDEARRLNPDEHERLSTAPGFIVFRLRTA